MKKIIEIEIETEEDDTKILEFINRFCVENFREYSVKLNNIIEEK